MCSKINSLLLFFILSSLLISLVSIKKPFSIDFEITSFSCNSKNLLTPRLVNFLNTLPRREIVCGYAEILKHSIIMKKSFYNFLNKNISKILKLKSPFVEKAIYESCKIKKSVIEKDEKEKGDRKVLNFGHTFAHAFEASLGYSKKLNHGEAVILGMNTALNFSFSKKYINKDDYNLIINHLNQNNLPCKIKNYFSVKDLNKILFFMTKDKKNYSNKINLILIKKIGSTIINKNFDYNVLKRFLINQLTN